MGERWNTDGSDPAEVEATAELEIALEKLMAVTHHDSVVLTGYIVQAVGVSPNDDRDLLTYKGKEGQSGVLSQGLLQYINANVDAMTWGGDDE